MIFSLICWLWGANRVCFNCNQNWSKYVEKYDCENVFTKQSAFDNKGERESERDRERQGERESEGERWEYGWRKVKRRENVIFRLILID